MNKRPLILIGVIVGVLAIGGGVYAYVSDQNSKKEAEKMAMEKKSESDAMMKKDEAAAMEKDKMAKESDAMKKDDAMMSKHGSYVTLADYNASPSKYADSKKVYFFHAPWCPSCQAIEKEINADQSKIPVGVTLIKTDFDTQTELRQKYGVTIQHTFVQVDSSGNETAQWSAESLSSLVAGIK